MSRSGQVAARSCRVTMSVMVISGGMRRRTTPSIHRAGGFGSCGGGCDSF
jgi:hypothetical protein